MSQVNTTTDRGVVERRTSRLTLVDLAGAGLPPLCAQLRMKTHTVLCIPYPAAYLLDCTSRCSHASRLSM